MLFFPVTELLGDSQLCIGAEKSRHNVKKESKSFLIWDLFPRIVVIATTSPFTLQQLVTDKK